MNLLITSSLCFLTLLFTSCSSVTELKKSEQYWAETEFDWADVQKVINDENCNQNAEKFFACAEATNRLLSLGENKWFIYPAKSSREKFKYPNHLAKIDFSKSIKVLSRSKENKERVKKDISGKFFNQSYKSAWINFYKSKKSIPIDKIFSTQIAYLNNSKDMTELNTNYYAGVVYSKYLELLVGKYTSLAPREQIFDRYSDDKKSYAGIGVMLREVDMGMLVEVVYDNTPAQKAGLQEGDIITAVTTSPGSMKLSLENKKIDESIDLIRGVAGTTIELDINRLGTQITKKVTREKVAIAKVNHKVENFHGKKILHLRVSNFYHEMFCPKLERVLRTSRPYDGILLDLRNNPGGSGEAAFCLAGFFLEEGKTILKDIYLRHGLKRLNDVVKEEVQKAESSLDTKTPLVVLVNRSSASSSEIVASALQDNGRAIIVGETTYGKGTGLKRDIRHEDVPYMEDEEDLFIYYVDIVSRRASGDMLEGVGVRPDIFLRPSLQKNINTEPKWKSQLDYFYWGYIDTFGSNYKAKTNNFFQKEKSCMKERMRMYKKLYGPKGAFELMNCLY